jgi:hypothetical protein
MNYALFDRIIQKFAEVGHQKPKKNYNPDLELIERREKDLINQLQARQEAYEKATEGFYDYLNECLNWIHEQETIEEV